MITSLSQPLAIAAGRARLGALVFAAPGLGILLTGLLALGSTCWAKALQRCGWSMASWRW
jgi:hypothetical protein